MRERGFTIIELLIVMVIMSTFLGVGYGRYRDFARRQEISIAKRSMVADLRQAQKNAVSGNKPPGCTTPLVGYAFEVIQSGPPAAYEIYILCSGTGGGPDQRTDLKTVELGDNIILTLPSTNPIIFEPLALGTNIPTGSSEVIDISNPGVSGSTGQISINFTGEIE